MAVRFFRATITGTDETKLQAIKDWVDTKIDLNDINEKCEAKTDLFESLDNDEFIFICDMYIKQTVDVSKYKDIIKNRFQLLDKTGLTSAKIIQYDNCSHDEEIHTPCQPTIRMEWSA